jgi:hypothetical protein
MRHVHKPEANHLHLRRPKGYAEYLEAMADPSHENHAEFLRWRGPFDSEAFDSTRATRDMRRGLPDWRSEDWL